MQVKQHHTLNRLFAVILLTGGIVGMAVSLMLAFRLMQQSFAALAMAAAFMVLYGGAALIGVGLWQGTLYGRKWAPLLFAFQIPRVMVPGLTYRWFTGAHFGPAIEATRWRLYATAAFGLGAGAEFSVGSPSQVFEVGVNVLAIIAFLWLARSYHSFKRSADRTMAA
jgi:hypothetical protein